MRYKTFQMSVKKVQLKGCQANKFNSIKKTKDNKKIFKMFYYNFKDTLFLTYRNKRKRLISSHTFFNPL